LELAEHLCRDLKAAIGIGDIQDLAKKCQTLNNLQVAVMLQSWISQFRFPRLYWGKTICSPQYFEKYWGECPHCPYGVGAYDCNKLPCYIEVLTVIAMQCTEILKITCGKKFLTNG